MVSFPKRKVIKRGTVSFVTADSFDASESWKSLFRKKFLNLNQYYDGIIAVVALKVKTETAQNKEAELAALVPRNEDMFSCKAADTFEEAVDMASRGSR